MDSDTDSLSWNHTSVDGDERIWSPKAVKLLLSLYLKHKEKFCNPQIRKKQTWQSILNEMTRCGINGLSVVSLDRKFRNLKRTFYVIRKKKRDNSETTIKWQYYNDMKKIFIDDEGRHSNLTSPAARRDSLDSHPPAQLCSIFDFIKEESIFYNEDDSIGSNSAFLPNATDPGTKNMPRRRGSACSNDELRGIRRALEMSNKIQQERNDLIRTYVEHMIKNNKT